MIFMNNIKLKRLQQFSRYVCHDEDGRKKCKTCERIKSKEKIQFVWMMDRCEVLNYLCTEEANHCSLNFFIWNEGYLSKIYFCLYDWLQYKIWATRPLYTIWCFIIIITNSNYTPQIIKKRHHGYTFEFEL